MRPRRCSSKNVTIGARSSPFANFADKTDMATHGQADEVSFGQNNPVPEPTVAIKTAPSEHAWTQTGDGREIVGVLTRKRLMRG
jgi:hypothetical protein